MWPRPDHSTIHFPAQVDRLNRHAAWIDDVSANGTCFRRGLRLDTLLVRDLTRMDQIQAYTIAQHDGPLRTWNISFVLCQ